MRTYGVICQATGFVVFVGQATGPLDACNRAVRDADAWGSIGSFQRSVAGALHDADADWLELSVYDVSGLLEPIPNIGIDHEKALAAMNELTHVDQFIARQYG
jgi:hypothetical protein